MSDDLDARARERLGEVLNEKWTLESLIGVGGMAAVYAARHRNGARAAIKVLHPELARHPEVVERFRREGYAANKVEHPGAVKVLDDDVVTSGHDEGAAYIVMELLEGESLQDRVERGPAIGEREFLVIADRVLEVLEVAHAKGVVHRDIKPENIFLLRGEGVKIKVLDFGLARLQEAQSITTHGLALGTPSFMSPEQAGGKTAEIDGRTDLFSVAATGFRLITGLRIHEGEGPVVLVTKMAQLPAPPIRSVAPHVSEPFARVIDCALQFRREDRYPSATVMRADVQKAIAEIDDAARAVEPTVELSASHLEPEREARPPAKRRSPWAFVVLAVLAAAAVKLAIDPSLRARLFAMTASADGPSASSTASPAAASASPSADPPAAVDASARPPVASAAADAAIADAASDADDDDDADTDLDASPSDEHTSPDQALDAAKTVTEAGPPKRPPPPRKPNAKPPRKRRKH